MHKYEDYIDIVDGDEMKEDEIDCIVCGALEKLKAHDEDDYEAVMMKIHCVAHEPHFDEHLAKKAVSEMKNVDGTTGEHWTLEETTRVMDQNGIKANKYDWYYLLNMLHSDYSHLWGEDVAQYVKFAKAYINDPDAGTGKVFYLWRAGKHHHHK